MRLRCAIKDLLTFLPTQAFSKSRPKRFHPITLPQPSSSYSPLPFSLPHSNIISFTIHSYGHTICHHSYLPLPILHHPIFLLQHLQCVPLPFHLSRASPSYATEFAFTPLRMAHLEGVVHKCNNLSWGCCFSDIKCLSKKNKKRVNWRQLYKKDETTSTTDPSGRLKRHRKEHFAGVWCFSGTHLFFIYIHTNASAAEKKARLNE